MTTRADSFTLHPWWRYLGPWPARPALVAILAATFFTFTALATAILERSTVATVGFVPQMASVVTSAITVWAFLLVMRRIQDRWAMGLPAYLIAFLVAATAGVVVRTYTADLADVNFASPLSTLLSVVRLWLPLVAINSIIGVATARLQDQVAKTEAALSLAREQQDRMLEADEHARRQVADALHDRVQAGLIAACLQLQDIDPADRAAIDTVIARLEELRKVDVRRAARALSPTLSEVGLASSLSELASQFEPGMVTLVTVEPLIDAPGFVDERTRLGIYRIVEQALLNAAIHGRARMCEVRVGSTAPGQAPGAPTADADVVVEVDDNGRGFREGPRSDGSGAALVSAWTQALGGSWSWGDRPEGGARVSAALPGHRCDVAGCSVHGAPSVPAPADAPRRIP